MDSECQGPDPPGSAESHGRRFNPDELILQSSTDVNTGGQIDVTPANAVITVAGVSTPEPRTFYLLLSRWYTFYEIEL